MGVGYSSPPDGTIAVSVLLPDSLVLYAKEKPYMCGMHDAAYGRLSTVPTLNMRSMCMLGERRYRKAAGHFAMKLRVE